jgi:hypothetical protein
LRTPLSPPPCRHDLYAASRSRSSRCRSLAPILPSLLPTALPAGLSLGPQPAGAAGAPQAGAGGSPSAGTGGVWQGGAAGYHPGGAGGAPAGETLLCVVPRSPAVDPDLNAFRLELATSLTAQGWGDLETVLAAWVTRREPFSDTLVALPPASPDWTPERLRVVLFGQPDKPGMPGGGRVDMATPGCATCGFRSPCDVTRLTGIRRDVAHLPAGARR